MKALYLLCFVWLAFPLAAQVAINSNGSLSDASAMLDVQSTNKGLLTPRMTKTQRQAIHAPATGLLIYQTDSSGGYYYNGGTPDAPQWLRLGQLSLPYADSAPADPYTHVFKVSTSWAHFAPAIYGLTSSQEGIAITGENNSGASSGTGIMGKTNTNSGIGVRGQHIHTSGLGVGVSGQSSSTTGTGVEGFASAATGENYGVYGSALSPDGLGVYGQAKRYGLWGYAYEASGRGITGEVVGTGSIGVYGKALAANSTGVWGEGYNQGVYGVTAFSTGKGVYGKTSAATGMNHGVYGESVSASGFGVYGTAPNYGVYGKSTHDNSTAVTGVSTGNSGIGVLGQAGTNGYGVFGTAAFIGIHGESTSADGCGARGISVKTGVLGVSSGTQGRAVWGQANSTNSIGVFGKAVESNSTGVWGEGALYDFYAAGPGTNYGAASSVRWKNNIMIINHPLEKIQALRGVYFTWDEAHGGQHDVGMIAEEVGKVMPEIVVYESNGLDASGIDYSKITPLLLEGIKALKAENDQLRARLEHLEREVKGMRKK